MSAIFKPIITTAGRDAISQAIATGQPFSIEKLVIGSGTAPADASTRALSELRDTVPVDTSSREGQALVHVTATLDREALEFPVREVGFLTNKGVLFAVYGTASQDFIAYKVRSQQLLLAFDLYLDEIPAAAITVRGPGERLNLSIAAFIAKIAAEQQRQAALTQSLIQRIAALEAKQNGT